MATAPRAWGLLLSRPELFYCHRAVESRVGALNDRADRLAAAFRLVLCHRHNSVFVDVYPPH